MKNIVWLASYPKSGNTWLRAFLSNYLSGADKPVSINQLAGTPIASSRALFERYAGLSSYLLSPDEYDLLRPEVYRAMSEEAEEISFRKVHDAYRLLSNGQALFPADCSKAVIYIIRDPRQVCLSLTRYGNFETVDQAIENMNNPHYCLADDERHVFSQMRQQVFDWSGHVKSWTRQGEIPCLVIRYEDILADAELVFEKVIRFIHVPVNLSRLRLAVQFSRLEELSEQERSTGFNEGPTDLDFFFSAPGSSVQPDQLSSCQRALIWERHKEVMSENNYSR